ncbi:MAG TPA: S9 family peptidase [Mycobacteriales bacterium]
MTNQTGQPSTPFHDLSEYVALPRLSGLAVSPDGTRLVTSVATLSSDAKKYVTSLWELDPAGNNAARRLTRSTQGESQPVFLPDGALLFTSARPDPESAKDKADVPTLWILPADGGEARQVASRPGGIETVVTAVDSGRVVFGSSVMPGATTAEDDEKARKARADAKVSAILHEHYPVRYWDHDLGPAESRVFTAGAPRPDQGRLDGEPGPRDLTPRPDGRANLDHGLAVSPDGSTVALAWGVDQGRTIRRDTIVLIDTTTGERRTVASEPGFEFLLPSFLPDGRSLVCVRETMSTFDRPGELTLWLVDLASGQGRDLLPDFPNWPNNAVPAPDGSAVYFSCDEQGHAPVFRVDLGSGTVTRLTASGAYGDLVASRDGSWLYALRASVDSPPTPVRLDPAATDQDPLVLPSPGEITTVPGRVVEARATAPDGADVHYWLVLPEGASAQVPAPLVLWIHGGPLNSWNSWSWRWNPWLMAARGYAVLLPDPALSTGYGNDFVRRGWGHWGDRPYHDLMAVTDAVCARDDIDAGRTAAMGGSFGGYMANWVASHTDRFRAIVTHAGLWSLDQFLGTTDGSGYWQREFGDPLREPERYQANSPHRFVGQIRTPMLVVHGDRDYRVPIGEALHLWYDLMRHDVEAKFLYFPDENHWVLSPGNAQVWYQTVHAFLAQHVLGQEWERPELL